MKPHRRPPWPGRITNRQTGWDSRLVGMLKARNIGTERPRVFPPFWIVPGHDMRDEGQIQGKFPVGSDFFQEGESRDGIAGVFEG